MSNAEAKDDPIALYIVVRESLNMGMGKACAQVGHAVEKVVNAFWDLYDAADYACTEQERDRVQVYWEWRDCGVRKIVLRADEKEWAKLKEEFGGKAFIVIDSGITELVPNTETVMAFWPQHKSTRSKLLKRLQALQ